MRWLLTLLVLLPSLALAQFPISRGGTVRSGPRILGEPAFAFELDALEQAEATRPGWPVTTTRASTRMCWTGSAWQTVDANVPCIGRYGLASFGAGTNYWANSTTPSLWPQQSNVTVDGNVITDISASQSGQIRPANTTVTVGANLTVSCILQAGTTDKARLWAGGPESNCPVTLTSQPARYSCPGTANSTTVAPSLLVGHAASDTGSIIAHQCQFEVSPTPGPRHDCEAAPCSWAADVHTVSTAGWPVEAGEVRLQYRPHANLESSTSYFLLSAETFNVAGWSIYIRNGSTISMIVPLAGGGSSAVYSSPALTWIGCDPTNASCAGYDIRVVWGGGTISFYRNGTLAGSVVGATMPIGPLPAAANIGSRTGGVPNPANGHIRLLRVSQ